VIVTVPPLTSSSALVLPPDTDTPLTTEVAGLMVSGPLVVVSIVSGVRSVIVAPVSGEANTISSSAEVLEDAEPIAARREPAPESVAFVTVNVSAVAAAGSATKAVTPEIRTARAEEWEKMSVPVGGDGEHGRRRAELQFRNYNLRRNSVPRATARPV
jgi:hypothetical protein